MFSRSIRPEYVVLAGALLVGCSSNSDKPGTPSNGGSASGGDGSDNAAGTSATAGSAGKTSGGGSTSGGGTATGGTAQAGGTNSAGGVDSTGGASGGDASGGQPPTGGDGDPPALEGDGISWTWNGKTYTANKNPHNGFYPAVMSVNISAADTTDAIPPNAFMLHLLPDKVGTFQCKDYVNQTDSSFVIAWGTFDTSMNPPNPSFGYSPDLPCEFTITRADPGDKAGDVLEGTFKATLHFALMTPDYGPKDRSVVGRMRVTKQ